MLGFLSPNKGFIKVDEIITNDGFEITNNWVSYVPQSVYLILHDREKYSIRY